jgi:uncharacterized protein
MMWILRPAIAALLLLPAACMPPSWGADALLHPPRHAPAARPAGAEDIVFDAGIKLRGWRFKTDKPRRGTIVYLHGLSDNRASSTPIARHYTPLGFDVVAYDGRSHGESGGDACTYGFYEKRDLSRVLDALGGGPVVVFGASLGAGIALQAAADEPRIAALIGIAPISDLRTAAIERAPFFASRKSIEEAFRLAEERGKFRIDDVSPAAAAARVRIPVVLVHGADDQETPPSHSQKVHAALAGAKQLILVPGAGHNDTLTPQTWAELDRWMTASLSP